MATPSQCPLTLWASPAVWPQKKPARPKPWVARSKPGWNPISPSEEDEIGIKPPVPCSLMSGLGFLPIRSPRDTSRRPPESTDQRIQEGDNGEDAVGQKLQRSDSQTGQSMAVEAGPLVLVEQANSQGSRCHRCRERRRHPRNHRYSAESSIATGHRRTTDEAGDPGPAWSCPAVNASPDRQGMPLMVIRQVRVCRPANLGTPGFRSGTHRPAPRVVVTAT